MFPNQFGCIIETVCMAANMIALVASDDYSHSLFADTRFSDDYDTSWFRLPARRTTT
jgi:hypothetical protein